MTEQRKTATMGAPDAVPIAAFPPSYAQQRLWILDGLISNSAAYNDARLVRLVGPLDTEALGRAFNDLVARQESLRTRLALGGEAPVQDVLEHLEIELPVTDLSATISERSELLAVEAAQRQAHLPFDLREAPLFRAHVLRLSTTEHLLLVVMHHVITDGWSSEVFWRELAALYTARVAGNEADLPPLPIQYADYAVWQRQWLSGERLAREVGYWREALEGMPVLELPTDRVRPAVASYGGGRVEFELPAALVGQLKALARRERATLFMVLLAGFEVLLWRYSGQEDFGVGVPIAGRTRPELEGLIGFFVNTLVMRARLEGQPSFREHLGRVREAALGAYEHQELPFDKLVEELNPPRDLSRNPLFQVSFAMQNVPDEGLQLHGLEAEPIRGISGVTSKFDLTLWLTETPAGLFGGIEYATDLFDRDRIERMAGHYRVLLEGAVADPQCSVAQLPLLTEAERQQLLVQFNDTAREYPREKCVHQLVEEQVRRSPEAVAVVFGEQRLTYRELEERANRLAHRLRELGVGPEVLVGVCLERSLELVVGLLGILKAGGAYVPLDPGYPAQRLAFMLQDTAAPVLLTQGRLLGQLPQYEGRVVCLDRDWGEIERQPATAPENLARPENLAYVIYTSGSTGTPKGVMIEQQALVNHMAWMGRCFPLTREDRVLQKTPMSADASVWEFWAPLLQGAQLVVAPPQIHRSPVELEEVVRMNRITVVQLVPTMLAALLADPGVRRCETLRRVFCGGEALRPDLVRSLSEQSNARIVNLYGPTEVTIDSVVHECSGSDITQVPIGKPVDNIRAFVCDANHELVPVGVRGELYLAGDGVARGYWRRPHLTAERFMDGLPAAAYRGPLYRTGDRACWRPDGTLEFRGRVDGQVKVRGVRVELGEIETALSKHASVADAAVTVFDNGTSEPRLVAYFVSAGTQPPTPADLQRHLRASLLEQMLPQAYVCMPEMPRLPNGKLDRKALRRPTAGDLPLSKDKVVPPRNEAESKLVDLWAEVLCMDRECIGVDQDFFDLGGHSLRAMQLIARMRAVFGVPVTTLEFFASPTVAGCANFVEAGSQRRGDAAAEGPMAVPRHFSRPAQRRGEDRLRARRDETSV